MFPPTNNERCPLVMIMNQLTGEINLSDPKIVNYFRNGDASVSDATGERVHCIRFEIKPTEREFDAIHLLLQKLSLVQSLERVDIYIKYSPLEAVLIHSFTGFVVPSDEIVSYTGEMHLELYLNSLAEGQDLVGKFEAEYLTSSSHVRFDDIV